MTEQAPLGSGGSQDGAHPEAIEQTQQTAERAPGFGERGRMRRRARFLRRARELAYRDLGGLVFDLHRFGQRNDQLVLAKLAMLRQIDTEVRELEQALGDRRAVTVLREVGIAACPRCAALHDSDDRFCPGCGLAFDTNADRPISTAPMVPRVQTPTPMTPPLAPASASVPAPAAPTLDRTPAVVPAKEPAVVPAKGPVAAPPKEPVAAPRASPAPFKPAYSPPASSERGGQEEAFEDESTQVLRPGEPDK